MQGITNKKVFFYKAPVIQFLQLWLYSETVFTLEFISGIHNKRVDFFRFSEIILQLFAQISELNGNVGWQTERKK
jgi:hypothetical protein